MTDTKEPAGRYAHDPQAVHLVMQKGGEDAQATACGRSRFLVPSYHVDPWQVTCMHCLRALAERAVIR